LIFRVRNVVLLYLNQKLKTKYQQALCVVTKFTMNLPTYPLALSDKMMTFNSMKTHTTPALQAFLYVVLIIFASSLCDAQAQNLVPVPTKTKSVYSTLVADLAIQFANKQLKTEDETEITARTIVFTNFTNFTHFNFGNNFGLVPGMGLRNIGVSARDEHIDDKIYKRTVHRVYTLNASLAVKLGSFSKHCFVYGGGEYDMAFHFRQKLKTYSNSKKKQGEWFSNATDRFLPSVFIGVQLPKGLNLKCSYYFNDFFNKNYKGKIENFPVYTQSHIVNIAVSFQFHNNLFKLMQQNLDAKSKTVEM